MSHVSFNDYDLFELFMKMSDDFFLEEQLEIDTFFEYCIFTFELKSTDLGWIMNL